MTDTPSASAQRPMIELSDVTVRYGGNVVALDNTPLRIDKGDFVALVGPSGCGKSTILKLVAGLLEPTAGAAIVGGREVGAIGSHAKRLGLAFQNPTMLPWLSILDNVMIPLKIVEPFRQDYRRKRKGEFRERAEALLEQVGLAGFGNKRPWQLSGGMLQRASLCRALVHEPDILLLDEPFGALDQFTREELWDTMQDLWINRRPTVLLVTHDLREAVGQWTGRYEQRAWLRQLEAEVTPAMEDALLSSIARLDGTPFPSTAALVGRWARGRVRRAAPAELTYCAEVVATAYVAMGLLPDDLPSNYYDPGRFWSGDDLELRHGARLGEEGAVDV